MECHPASAQTKNHRTRDPNAQLRCTRNRSLDPFIECRRTREVERKNPGEIARRRSCETPELRASKRRPHANCAKSKRFLEIGGGELALALVTGALEQFPLLVLAHLLAPLFDHTTHEWTSRLGTDGYWFIRRKSTRGQPKAQLRVPSAMFAAAFRSSAAPPVYAPQRSCASACGRPRNIPIHRLITCRRGRNPSGGRRLTPSSMRSSRICWFSGSIIKPRRR